MQTGLSGGPDDGMWAFCPHLARIMPHKAGYGLEPEPGTLYSGNLHLSFPRICVVKCSRPWDVKYSDIPECTLLRGILRYSELPVFCCLMPFAGFLFPHLRGIKKQTCWFESSALAALLTPAFECSFLLSLLLLLFRSWSSPLGPCLVLLCAHCGYIL